MSGDQDFINFDETYYINQLYEHGGEDDVFASDGVVSNLNGQEAVQAAQSASIENQELQNSAKEEKIIQDPSYKQNNQDINAVTGQKILTPQKIKGRQK
ncbi:MAG TPA: hypothetical protein VIL23_01640 [Clostridia bacterium]